MAWEHLRAGHEIRGCHLIMGLKSLFTAGGWQIPWFGKGRSPLLSRNANELVRALNALGKIAVTRDAAATADRVAYSDGGITIVLAGQAAGLGGEGGGALTIKEQDDDPTIENVTEIRFPNGSVTDEGGGVVSVNAGGMTYRGDWDSGEDYIAGDVVRRRTGSYQGVYVAVQSNTNSAPVYPEPVDPDWHILSLGVVATYQITDDPDNPVKTVYVNQTEGYL